MREAHVAKNDEIAFKNIEEPKKHMYGEDFSKKTYTSEDYGLH
jgi:hypothetical protein